MIHPYALLAEMIDLERSSELKRQRGSKPKTIRAFLARPGLILRYTIQRPTMRQPQPAGAALERF
jgi:hypothetical protein